METQSASDGLLICFQLWNYRADLYLMAFSEFLLISQRTEPKKNTAHLQKQLLVKIALFSALNL